METKIYIALGVCLLLIFFVTDSITTKTKIQFVYENETSPGIITANESSICKKWNDFNESKAAVESLGICVKRVLDCESSLTLCINLLNDSIS